MTTEMAVAQAPRGWARIARRIRVPLGFLFAVVYLVLAQPNGLSVGAGSTFVILGLVLRATASGQLRKNEQLVTSGPYSYTRNPLYLGSILIGVGFSMAARSLWVWVLLIVLFVFVYVPVIRSEEQYLRSTFPDFDFYATRVPRLLPRWSGESLIRDFSRERYLKHHEYNALIGAALMILAIAIKMLVVKHAGN